MPRPTRYYVEYSDEAAWEAAKQQRGESSVDMADFLEEEQFDDLDAARAFMKSCPGYAAIYERKDIYDTTHPSIRADGISWYTASFDEELIEDQ